MTALPDAFTDKALTHLPAPHQVLSLLKLIRPEFRSLHPNQSSILVRVSSIADLLASTAVDAYHTPALYAVLLKSLIQAKSEELKTETRVGVVGPGVLSRPGSPTGNGGLAGEFAGAGFAPYQNRPGHGNGAGNGNAMWGDGAGGLSGNVRERMGMQSHMRGDSGSSLNPGMGSGMMVDPTMAASLPDGGGNGFGLSNGGNGGGMVMDYP